MQNQNGTSGKTKDHGISTFAESAVFPVPENSIKFDLSRFSPLDKKEGIEYNEYC